jgi:hypothetical protein
MNYLDNTRTIVKKTVFVTPEEMGAIPGDHLANSRRTGYEVIADGGIDFRTVCSHPKTIERYRAKGMFFVLYKDKKYRYILRKK